MVDERLRSYVEKAMRHNADPGKLKHTLIVTGWPRRDVEQAISDAYGSRPAAKGKNMVVTLVVLLAVIILVGVILLISRTPSTQDNQTYIQQTNKASTTNKCAAVHGDEAKDQCYQELAAQGFDCGSLSDETEKGFCFRALEYYLVR